MKERNARKQLVENRQRGMKVRWREGKGGSRNERKLLELIERKGKRLARRLRVYHGGVVDANEAGMSIDNGGCMRLKSPSLGLPPATNYYYSPRYCQKQLIRKVPGITVPLATLSPLKLSKFRSVSLRGQGQPCFWDKRLKRDCSCL